MHIKRTPTDVACACTIVGTLLVCAYPGVGTALAWELGLSDTTSRRFLQAAALGLGLMGLALGVHRRAIPQAGRIMRPILVAAALGAAVPLLAAAARGLSGWGGCSHSPSTLAMLAFGALWCAVSAVWVLSAAWAGSTADAEGAGSACPGVLVRRLLALCGVLLAVHVWVRGPGGDGGLVHLSMGGNQTLLAVFFLACSAFVSWRGGVVGVLAATPWLYLSIATTSRLAWLVVPLFAFWVPMSRATRRSGPRGLIDRQLLLGPLFVSIAAAFVVLPVSPFGIPLPYRDSAGSFVDAREWAARQGRAGRMITLVVPDEAIAAVIGAIDWPILREAWHSARVPDDRPQMWTLAMAAIGSSPLGAWPCPVQLRTLVRSPDGSSKHYSYSSPHNLCLELGMRFGWGGGLMALLGSLGLAWMAIRVLATTCDATAACASIGCLVELVRAQFSGDLWDGMGLIPMGCIVALAHLLGSAVASAGCRSTAPPGT